MLFFVILANFLKPAPGTHSGTHLTVMTNAVSSSESVPLTETHTDGEKIHEKGSRHQGNVNSSHRFLRC